MNKLTFSSLILFYLLFFIKETYPQDSLYLVDTLTGTAANNKLWKAEGIGDFNGDGLDDFIVCYDQYVDLYFGKPRFIPQLAHRFYPESSNSGLKGIAFQIGDINGDGYTDLMFLKGDTSYSPTYPYYEIIFGGKELDTVPQFKYYPPYYWKMVMSIGLFPLGDLNNDGYNDFAVASTYNWDDGLGRVYIFKGGKILTDTPWVVLKGPLGISDMWFGSSVIGIGDYNNDGYDDFFVSNSASADKGRVYLYLGNKDSINSTPFQIFGPSLFGILSDVNAAGDLNGDGKGDFIISSYDNKKAYVFCDNDPVILDLANLRKASIFSIGTDGDINHDGFNDFLIGSNGYKRDSLTVGKFVVFFGKPNIDITFNFSIEGYQQYSGFATDLSIPGDINGDRFADVFVLAPSFRNYDNVDSTVGRLYLYSYAKTTGIKNKEINVPSDFMLNQNYPNPFNPTTVISFQIFAESYVTLKIYSALGQEIAILINNEVQVSGEQKITFDANKFSLSSGVYFLEMNVASINSQTTQFHKEIKMIYLK